MHPVETAFLRSNLADLIAQERVDKDTGVLPDIEVFPIDRENTWMIRGRGMADTVLSMVTAGSQTFVSFQPAIPSEATQYETPPPVKTRPLNNDDDVSKLAKSISMYAGTDFFEWQAEVILESAKAAHWNGFSAALIAQVQSESWAPNVSKGDDGSVTMKFGRVQAKATADGLAIKYTGKPESYVQVLRGVFRADLED